MRSRESLPFGYAGCPITGKKADVRGFVDTGKTIRVGSKLVPLIVSVSGAHILGRHVGMLEREDAQVIREENIELKQQNARLEEELQDADGWLDGVDALKRKGLTVQRRSGRPKTKKADQAEE